MAKQKSPAAEKDSQPQASPLPPQAASDRPRRYCVRLCCPTPLAANPLVVEAATESEARRKFNAENGIGDSDHRYEIDVAE